MKDLRRQAFGGRSSFGMLRDLVAQAPALMEQAGSTLAQYQSSLAEQERLQRVGVDAMATVRGVHDTGGTITVGGADNPIASLDLDVHRAGMPDVRTTTRTSVPRLFVPRLVLGATLPVKVDPADPSKVIVVWSDTDTGTHTATGTHTDTDTDAGAGGGAAGNDPA